MVFFLTLGMLISTYNSYKEATNITMNVELAKLAMLKKNILRNLQEQQNNLLALTEVPPIQAILRAKKNNDLDPLSNDTLQQWENRLVAIFQANILNHSQYYQIRYIDKNGIELVRVDRNSQGIISIKSKIERQDKSHSNYVRETLKLAKSEVYYSDIDLNKEYDIIEQPPTAVLRIATPIYMDSNEAQGLVIINLFTDGLFAGVNDEKHGTLRYVVDKQGNYLKHSDDSLLINNLLNNNKALEQFEPDLFTISQQASQYIRVHDKHSEIDGFQKIYFSPTDRNKYWLIISHIPKKTVLSSIIPQMQRMLLSSLIFGCLMILLSLYFINKSILLPIMELAKATELLRQGNLNTRVNPDKVSAELKSLYLLINEFAATQQLETKRLNTAVEEKTKKLSTLIDNIIDGIVTVNRDGTIETFNPAAEKMFAYSAKEMMGENFKVLMPEHYFQKRKLRFKKFLPAWVRRIKGKAQEVTGLRKDGSSFVLELHISELTLDGVKQYIAVLRDITKRKQAEQSILQYKQALDTTHDGFWMANKEGFLTEANVAYTKQSGYSTNELIGMHINQLDANESDEETKAHIEKVIKDGWEVFETKLYHKDGHIIPVEISVSYEQDTQRFIVFSRDISERKQLEQELKLLARFPTENPNPVLRVDINGKIIYANHASSKLFACWQSKVEGNIPQQLLKLCLDALTNKKVKQHDLTYDTSVYQLLIYPINEANYLNLYAKDISKEKMAEEQLRIAAASFETHEAIMITDKEANIIRVNKAFSDVTGYSADEVIGQNPRMMSSGRHDRDFYLKMWQRLLHEGHWSGEIYDRRKNGQVYPKWATISAVKDPQQEVSHYVAIFSDITERKLIEQEIHNLAFYDTLTKLPNRRLFLDRFKSALIASERRKDFGAIMFIDLDRFKILNDSLGHEYGDLLLIEVGVRIKSCIREMDTAARFGGDEFVVLLEGLGVEEPLVTQHVALVAEKIRIALSQPYQLKGHEHLSSPSIGVNIFSGNKESIDMLLEHADMAMYQAKTSGRNTVKFFDPIMQKNITNHDMLKLDLEHAIALKQLQLYYQLQVDNDNQPIGAEAFLRWEHPQHGILTPDRFIAIAEETDIMISIDRWVLITGCQQLSLWQKDHSMKQLKLTINISSAYLESKDFVDEVKSTLKENNIKASLFKIELPEQLILSSNNSCIDKIMQLKNMGMDVSMDNLATLYSSISFMQQLSSHQLKVHKEFVQNIDVKDGDTQLIKTIVKLAKSLNLEVIAEGVETKEQLEFLQGQDCHSFQGYLFSKPVTITEFNSLMKYRDS